MEPDLTGLQRAPDGDLLEREFHALVRCGEAEPLVEPVRRGTGLVAGQLDQGAVPPPGFADRPADDGRAKAKAAVALIDPDRLDLGPQRTAAGQAGQEGQLHGGHDVRARLRHHQQVRRIAVDGLEGRLVGGSVLRRPHSVPAGAKLVGGHQLNNRRNVAGFSPPQDDPRRAQVKRLQYLHLPSLPGPSGASAALAFLSRALPPRRRNGMLTWWT